MEVNVKIAYGAIVLLAAALSTARTAGAAETATEERQVSGFDRIVVRGVGELIINQAEREALVVEAEKRLLPAISTEVRQGVLYFDIKEPQISTRYPIRYRLTVRKLVAIESHASGDIRVGRLETPSLDILLAGSGNVRVERLNCVALSLRINGSADIAMESGAVGKQTLSIAGSGNYSAAGLESNEATVAIAGSGSAELAARNRLVARIPGSGVVRYYGDPKVETSIAGAGTVERAGGR
jgi:hypothetical protein